PVLLRAERQTEHGRLRDPLTARPPRTREHRPGNQRALDDRIRSGREPPARAEGNPVPVPRRGLRATRQPVYSPRPLRAKMRGLRGRLRILAVVLIALGIGTAVFFPDAARTAATLPIVAFFSIL